MNRSGTKQERVATLEDWLHASRGAHGARVLFLAMLVVACGHASKPTAPGCCDKSGPTSAADAAVDARAAAESAAAKPAPRFRREEGCARDFKSSGEAVQDIVELQRLCAQGLAPLLPEAVNGRASNGEGFEVPVRVTKATACLRAVALGGAQGMTAALVNERGAVVASAVSGDSLVLVPADGTACVREPGTYRIVVRAARGASDVSAVTVQAWQATRE